MYNSTYVEWDHSGFRRSGGQYLTGFLYGSGHPPVSRLAECGGIDRIAVDRMADRQLVTWALSLYSRSETGWKKPDGWGKPRQQTKTFLFTDAGSNPFRSTPGTFGYRLGLHQPVRGFLANLVLGTCPEAFPRHFFAIYFVLLPCRFLFFGNLALNLDRVCDDPDPCQRT